MEFVSQKPAGRRSAGRGVRLSSIFSPPFLLCCGDTLPRVGTEYPLRSGTSWFGRIPRSPAKSGPDLLNLRFNSLLLQFETFESCLKHDRVVPRGWIFRH